MKRCGWVGKLIHTFFFYTGFQLFENNKPCSGGFINHSRGRPATWQSVGRDWGMCDAAAGHSLGVALNSGSGGLCRRRRHGALTLTLWGVVNKKQQFEHKFQKLLLKLMSCARKCCFNFFPLQFFKKCSKNWKESMSKTHYSWSDTPLAKGLANL